MIRVTGEQLHGQIVAILTAWGMPADAATTTADVMVDTDLSGIDSHGVSMLTMYEGLRQQDRLDLAARPEVVRDLAAFAVVDGHHGLGHPVGVYGMRVAVDKARMAGIGAVAVRNSQHFGALGYYARLAADEGLVGFVTTSTRAGVVAPIGGTTPTLGTNPLSFAAPRAGGSPLVLDMSTSVVAVNKVKAHWLKGLDVPAGWVFDRAGTPLTDAKDAYERLTTGDATLAPLGGSATVSGGHKGYGLSLMVQVLSAALSNAAAPGHDGTHDNIGHFFLAIDQELVNPGGHTADHVAELCRTMESDDPAVLVPGQPEEHVRAERSANGVPITDVLHDQLAEICRRAGVPLRL
jgi:LDH2 family malate/lactate/ureidoglycolate dehydrogenase